MLLEAMRSSMQWHREHERATLYSVLNAARAWRFAGEDVNLRHGRGGNLDEAGVQELLDHVEHQVATALASAHPER